MPRVACVTVLNKLAWEAWTWQVTSTCCLVCFSFPLSSAGKILLTRVVEIFARVMFSFSSSCLCLSFALQSVPIWKGFPVGHVFLPVTPVLFSLPSSVWTLCPLCVLSISQHFLCPEYKVQFFSPCYQTKPLSCPLLPAVISVTHLLNPQASFIPRQMSLLVLSWNISYGFSEYFFVYISHYNFDFLGVITSVSTQWGTRLF